MELSSWNRDPVSVLNCDPYEFLARFRLVRAGGGCPPAAVVAREFLLPFTRVSCRRRRIVRMGPHRAHARTCGFIITHLPVAPPGVRAPVGCSGTVAARHPPVHRGLAPPRQRVRLQSKIYNPFLRNSQSSLASTKARGLSHPRTPQGRVGKERSRIYRFSFNRSETIFLTLRARAEASCTSSMSGSG